MSDIYDRLRRKLIRSHFAYKSVLTGANPVIGTSNHQYRKLKNWLLWLSTAVPILCHNSLLKSAIRLTHSNRRIVVIPVPATQTLIALYTAAVPASVSCTYICIQTWTTLRSFYFASYLATLAFCIDDPNHRIYKTSKLMRNTI